MSINLQKGQKISLAKQSAVEKLTVGLGWDVAANRGERFDLDAHAYLLNEKGKCVLGGHVYYGNLDACHKSVVHTGDNLTGVGEGDDEQILVDLSKIPTNVARIRFVVKIYQAKSRGQKFGRVNNAFIHVSTPASELCRYNLTDKYEDATVMVVGEMYRHNDEWKFSAIGEGFANESDFEATIK